MLRSSALFRTFHFLAWGTNKTFPKGISRHRRQTLAGYASKQVLRIRQTDWDRWHALHLWTTCGRNCFSVTRCLIPKANLSSKNIWGGGVSSLAILYSMAGNQKIPHKQLMIDTFSIRHYPRISWKHISGLEVFAMSSGVISMLVYVRSTYGIFSF